MVLQEDLSQFQVYQLSNGDAPVSTFWNTNRKKDAMLSETGEENEYFLGLLTDSHTCALTAGSFQISLCQPFSTIP